jgi:hypothetical protein
VAFVREKLRQPAPSDAEVDRLIARLDAAAPDDRDAAAREIDRLGRLAVPRLRAALPQAKSAEARRRLEQLLRQHDRPDRLTGVRLRERRAVELLESIGTAEARAVLKILAAGGIGPLARDAAAAGKRLGAE